MLAAEPTNPKDANAIRVAAEGGRTIGYLDRGYALEYREAFVLLARHGDAGVWRAKLIGGIGQKRSFGVMLSLKDAEAILTDIRDRLSPGTPASTSVQPF